MRFFPQAVRLLEELDDELDDFEPCEGVPCVMYCGRSGSCGARGGVGRTGNRVTSSFQAMAGSRQRRLNRLKGARCRL